MTFDIGNFIAEYSVNGVYRFSGENVLESFDLDAFLPIKTGDYNFSTTDPEERYIHYTAHQTMLIKSLIDNISETYFSDLNHEIRFNDMWSSVGENVHGWHNDLMRAWPGFNSSINCYFDTSDKTTGGQLQLHPAEEFISDNSDMLTSIYPKKYDIIILNQNTNFVHRVTAGKHQRRMFSLACGFFDFNPIL